MKRTIAAFLIMIFGFSCCHTGFAAEGEYFILYTGAGFEKESFLESTGAELIYEYENAGGLYVYADCGKYDEIKKYKGIIGVSRDSYYPGVTVTESINAKAEGGKYSLFGEEQDYKGEGALVAVIDAGCNISHPAFNPENITETLSKEKLRNILEEKNLNAERVKNGITADMVYKNSKFPFAFDYADGDNDVYGVSHGTGVCSVVAGNGGSYEGKSFSGILPGAQIVMMKVQSSSGSIAVSHMIAALEDAISLGVDGVNISIGSMSGFGGTAGEAVFEAAVNKAREKGIFVSVSAGNGGMLTEEGGYSQFSASFEKPLNGNTDYGVMASPAVYENAVAVGSCSADGAPSVFSAYGCGPAMELKPDICDSGNAVTVATNSGFTVSRGTSYSSPRLLGEAIAVKNKYKSRDDADGISQMLLMNTADIMRKDGVAVSPRKQGSGMANKERALGAKCVVFGEEGKANINLKDKLGKVFSGKFTVYNISGEAAEYIPSLELITDGSDGKRITGESVPVGNTAFFNPGKIIVEPGEKAEITFSVTVDEEFIRKNSLLFPNGFFLEGFISLSGDELISIPFMGYYGSWDSAPLFIPSDVKYGFGFAAVMMNRNLEFKNTYYYGNPFFPTMGISSPHINKENISFSPNGDGLLDTANIFAGLYRNAVSLRLVFRDKEGNIVYEMERTEIPKGLGLSTITHEDYRWNGNDMHGNPCLDGQYYMTAEGRISFEGASVQSVTLPLFIDRTPPVIEKAETVKEKDKTLLKAYFKDNGIIQTAAISGKGFTLFADSPDSTGAYVFDISGIEPHTFDIEAYDYGLNGSLDKITAADEYRVYYKDKKISRVELASRAYINGKINREYKLENGEDSFRIFIWDKNMKPIGE